MAGDNDDDIPMLEDIVRPGNGNSRDPGATDGASRQPRLSEAEIEAISRRVVERYVAQIERAIARAIRSALQVKARQQRRHPGESDSET